MSDGFGGLAGAAAMELHLKMSKKIAQLTKVIFHLNTRNEDFASEFAHCKRAHALELQQLTQDAATKVRQLQEQLQTQTTAAQQAERQALRDKLQLQKDLAQTKQKMQAQQSAAEQSFQQRVAQLEEQVDATRREFSARTQQLVHMAETQQQQAASSSSAATVALRSAHERELAALKQQQTDEVAELVTASNAKYNDMLATQLRVQDALRDELSAARAALEQELTHAASEHASHAAAQDKAARERLEQTKHDLVSKMEALLADAESLRGQENKLRQERAALLQTQGELQLQVKQLELQVAKATQEAQSVRQDADAHAQRLQQMLSASADKIDELAQERETLTKTLHARDQALRQAQRDLEAAQLETLQRNASLSEKDALLRQQSQAKELELATLRAEALASSQQRALTDASLHKQIQALEAQVAMSAKELMALHAALASCEQQLQQEKLRAAQEQRATANESDRRALELARAHDAQLAELHALHAQALETHVRDAEAKLQALKFEFQRNSSDSLAQTVAQLKAEHIEALSDQKRSLETAQQQELARVTAQLKALQSDASAKDKELAELRSKASDLAAQLKREQDQRATLQREHETQRTTAERALKQREDGLLKQLQELTTQRESVAKKLGAEKTQLQQQHSQTLVALTREHELKLRKLQDEWTAAKETQTAELQVQHERQATALRDELSALQSELERATRAHEETRRVMRESRALDHESHRSALLRLVDTTEARHTRAVQTLEQRLSDAAKRHANELEALGSRLTSEQQQRLSEAQERAELREMQLTGAHRTELEQRAQQHSVALRNLREELETSHASILDTLRTASGQQSRALAAQKDRECAAALHDAQLQHAAQLQEAQARHDKAQSALQTHADELQRTLAQTTAELSSSTRECERLRGALDAMAREMAERVAALERASREHVETLKRAAKQDMDRLLEENLAETKLLSDQFEETRRLMADKVVLLKQTIAEWEDRYARRESRAEDVTRIADLERLVAERDALVRQTLDEMAYFKRELLNREEMYNKTFARTPNVGVMNVLKPHVQLQAQMQMQGAAALGLGNTPNGIGGAPQMRRKTKPSTANGGPEVNHSSNELHRRNSERGPSSGSSTGVKKALPPLTNNQVAL